MTSIRTLIIFGATGDLTSRLLLPGLGTLLSSAPELRIDVVGSSREPAEDWAQVVAEAFDSVGASGPAAAHTRETARYVAGDVTDAGDLERLLDTSRAPSACTSPCLPR